MNTENITEKEKSRWACIDLAEALDSLKGRKEQGIDVAMDFLGEYAQNEQQAFENLSGYLNCLLQLARQNAEAGLAIKLSALGLSFSKGLAQENLERIIFTADEAGTKIEIDIEGTPSVADTIAMACHTARERKGLVLALQAYLDRTPDDIKKCLEAGLKIRLVKGAYRGDTEDFAEIQTRFLTCFDILLESGKDFDVGTHDPMLLKEMRKRLESKNISQVNFGFLKGLAEETKVTWAKNGMDVAEYIPYGANRRAYEMRRQAYLNNLARLGLEPAK